MKLTVVCYKRSRQRTSYHPFFHINLFNYVSVLKCLSFLSVILKNMRHVYMFFQFLFVDFSNVLYVDLLLNRCSFLFRFASVWKLFRAQKCEKINIAEMYEFSIDYYYVYQPYVLLQGNKTRESEHIDTDITKEKCTKNTNIEQMKTFVQMCVETISIRSEYVVLCFARTKILNAYWINKQ